MPLLMEWIRQADAGAPGKDALPAGAAALVVTSPPYNVGKEYEDAAPLTQYLDGLDRVWRECWRVLRDDGRIAVNIANTGRNPYIALNWLIGRRMMRMGYQPRGEVIWDKGASAGASTAWGSYRSPSNPSLRDRHEYIVIFDKGAARLANSSGAEPDIAAGDFCQATLSVWTFPTESAAANPHPAPFPVELPRRLIELYTYPGDLVVDPFAGSGTTGVAAIQTGRQFAGYELKPDYAAAANARIANSRTMLPGLCGARQPRR